jgi:hypothetical protein
VRARRFRRAVWRIVLRRQRGVRNGLQLVGYEPLVGIEVERDARCDRLQGDRVNVANHSDDGICFRGVLDFVAARVEKKLDTRFWRSAGELSFEQLIDLAELGVRGVCVAFASSLERGDEKQQAGHGSPQ